MATTYDLESSGTLGCPVCFQKFDSPRTLPCLHTICEKCLQNQITSLAQGRFLCPFCNSQIVPSDTQLPFDKWAASFPLNRLIDSLREIASRSGINDPLCEPCLQRGTKTTGDFWCVDCKEKLCHQCNKYHKLMKQLKDHKIVPIDDMEQNMASSIIFEQTCIRHYGHKLETVCLKHRELCCGVCIATFHKNCTDIRSVDNAAEEQSRTLSYNNIIKAIRKIKTEIDKIIEDKLENIASVTREKEQILSAMDENVDQAIEKLQRLRNAFKDEIENIHKEAKSCVLKNDKNIKSFMRNLSNTQNILASLENSSSARERFITFENLHSQIESHYHQLKLHLKDDVQIHLNQRTSNTLLNIEDRLFSLGSVEMLSLQSEILENGLQKIDNYMKKIRIKTKISTKMNAAQVEKTDPMASPVTLVKAVTQEKDGVPTWLTGGTFLADGCLVMVDRNNIRLLRYDDKYSTVTEYKIDGQPSDVAAGHNYGELYIAVNQNAVYKYKLGTELTIVRRIKAPQGAWGIAVCGSQIIVSTSKAVVIINEEGSTVKSISKSGYECYVAVSPKQCTIYHRDNNDIVCRTLQGKELFRYHHQELNSPLGVCVGMDDCVYICGSGSRNIHQLSTDGQRSRITLSRLLNISVPHSIMFHPRRKEFVVTSRREDTMFEVYRFK